MKKIAPIAVLALFIAFTMTSCKKKWTCECTGTVNGVSVSTSATDTEKRTKKDAKDLCEGKNGTTTVNGITSTVDCKLK